MKFLCTVGDSFMHGDGLLQTHCAEQFSDLSEQTMMLAMTGNMADRRVTPEVIDRIYSTLEPMTISGKLAKLLSVENLNFSQGGASMEGILLQTQLLVNYLQKNNIDPQDTLWLIGITSPCRKMFWDSKRILPFSTNSFLKTRSKEYCWSRGTWKSLMLSHPGKSQLMFEDIHQEILEQTPDVAMLINWTLNLNAILNLLEVAGIRQYLLMNMFTRSAFSLDTKQYNICLEEKEMLSQLRQLTDERKVMPAIRYDYGSKISQAQYRCLDGGHFNQKGNDIIVSEILQALEEGRHQ